MEKVVNEAHRSKFQTLEQFYTPEDLLVFDIETTGFTAEHTALYLIGCAYYKTVSGIYASGLIRMADQRRIF